MSNSRRSRHSNLSQGLNLSPEQLEQLVRQLGLAERLIESFFFLDAASVEDLPLFLSDGQRVDLKSVEKIASSHRTEYGRDVFYYWFWIEGQKHRVFSYNQILDQRVCFPNGRVITEPNILKTLSSYFGIPHDTRYVTIDGKEQRVYFFNELPYEYAQSKMKRYKADGSLFDKERFNIITNEVYTERQIKGAELYQELLQSLTEQPIQDLHETEASSEQVDMEIDGDVSTESYDDIQPMRETQATIAALRAKLVAEEDDDEIEEVVEDEIEEVVEDEIEEDDDEIEEVVEDEIEDEIEDVSFHAHDDFFGNGNENLNELYDAESHPMHANQFSMETEKGEIEEEKARDNNIQGAAFSAWQFSAINTPKPTPSMNADSTTSGEQDAKSALIKRGLFCVKNNIAYLTHAEDIEFKKN